MTTTGGRSGGFDRGARVFRADQVNSMLGRSRKATACVTVDASSLTSSPSKGSGPSARFDTMMNGGPGTTTGGRRRKSFFSFEEYIVRFSAPVPMPVIVLRVNNRINAADIKAQMLLQTRRVLERMLTVGELTDTDIEENPDFLKHLPFEDAQQYRLRVIGTNFHIDNETLPLHRISFFQMANKAFMSPKIVMELRESEALPAIDGLSLAPGASEEVAADSPRGPVEAAKSTRLQRTSSSTSINAGSGGETNKMVAMEIKVHLDVARLVGQAEMNAYMSCPSPEVDSFRTEATRLRHSLLQDLKRRRADTEGEDTDWELEGLPEYIDSEPMPKRVPDKIRVGVMLPAPGHPVVLMEANLAKGDTVGSVRDAAYRKLRTRCPAVKDRPSTDFLLKVTGFQEYMFRGNRPFVDYDHVRRCVGQRAEKISLTLVDRKEEPVSHLLQGESLPEFGIIDEMLCHTESREVEQQADDELDFQSIYDVRDPFRVRVIGLDDLFLNIDSSSSPSSALYFVMARVYHGGDVLGGEAMFTNTAVASGPSPRWNQWLTFEGLQIRDIPKGARICFSVFRRSASTSVSSHQMGLEAKDEPLFWIGCQLIDHRDCLRDSIESFRMWRGQADPIGTCTENVDPPPPTSGSRGELIDPVGQTTPSAPTLFVDFGLHSSKIRFPHSSPPSLILNQTSSVSERHLRNNGGSNIIHNNTNNNNNNNDDDDNSNSNSNDSSIDDGNGRLTPLTLNISADTIQNALSLLSSDTPTSPTASSSPSTPTASSSSSRPPVLPPQSPSSSSSSSSPGTTLSSSTTAASPSSSSPSFGRGAMSRSSPSLGKMTTSGSTSTAGARKPRSGSQAPAQCGFEGFMTAPEKQLQRLVCRDPLQELKAADKEFIWQNRKIAANYPDVLPLFLLSVNWGNCEQVLEAHRSLATWSPPPPLQALELLDTKFNDPVVRAYAVKRLNDMPDADLVDYLLQLTQALKHEAHHCSALAGFLLRRALMNRRIGHEFFWQLKSEMHLPEIAERFCLILEAYVRGCANHRNELIKQSELLRQLEGVAKAIKPITDPKVRNKRVVQEIKNSVRFPRGSVQLPIDARWETNALTLNKCKSMDSKKVPLWLVFKNAEEATASESHVVIFKTGDDLRQDVLTLQMIRLMDKFWKMERLDLRLNPYRCIATGDEMGMIEVVLNSNTMAGIAKSMGGVKKVWEKDTLTKWLKKKSKGDEKLMKKFKNNFALSCAGYVVATYVLGIGDRHNDNIMCTEKGHLFHIDFGHFLGNFKKKFGVKRERVPFVFNPHYAHVLDYYSSQGEKSTYFRLFLSTAQKAYNILRKRASIFITLFQMMLSTGIPELSQISDLEWLTATFNLHMSDADADQHLRQQILSALGASSTQVNDAIHILAH
eukprot:TRINITY_DN1123_c1_g1_i1.p1 TRINITY_DN1123_c1_g1~~TRINITY_DN1123_c1_g1_i1.p1  ORF type:complete len:1390 (-),score=408.34 TRINITY_DN1123_c1_g1_i1:32-4201(-)